MAESGTYDLTTIHRRQKLAEQMSAEAIKPRKIEHWMQGLAQLGEVGANEFALNRLDKQEKSAKAQEIAALMGMIGGGAPAAAAPAAASDVPAPAAPAGGADDYGTRIAGIESGGKYDALGPMTKGDRAYGKYQVMGANIPEWTKAHVGRSMAPDEFLADTGAQDAVFKGQFGNYAKKYGPEGAARAWFAGEGGMNDPNRKDILGTSVADYSKKFMGASPPAAPPTGRAAVAQAMTPNVIGQGGPATPDAEGVFPPDAVMLPPGPTDMSAQSKPTGPAAVAQAMAPAAPSGGLLSNATPEQRRAIAAGMVGREGSPARALATSLMTKLATPRDQWVPERGDDGSFYQRNLLTGERKVLEKSDILPDAAVKQKIEIARAGKPDTVINNTVNPILKGVGESFNERLESARASVPQIEGMFEARKALDQGVITGVAADPRLMGAKIANLFGLGTDAAANTEVLRSAVGNSVLAKAKTLGANPSNADRDYIEKVMGGSIALEEPSMRRLLDIQEKWARAAIQRVNADAKKLLSAQPKELAAVAPLLGVDEPPTYEEFLKANPIAAPAAAAAAAPAPAGAAPAAVPGKVRKFNVKTGAFE